MTTEHTPGPWQINHRAPDQICDADGEVRGCAPIAFVCGSISERKANAALIARAPEMAAEIARLQAQLAESRQQADALFNTGMSYCDKIEALQAQVDALADALQACIRSNERWSLTPGRTNAIAAARAALAAVGR